MSAPAGPPKRDPDRMDEFCLGFWRQSHHNRVQRKPGKCHGLLLVRATSMEQLKSMRTSRATASVRLVMPSRAQQERFAAQRALQEQKQQERRDAFSVQLQPPPPTKANESPTNHERTTAARNRQYERRRALVEKVWHKQVHLIKQLPQTFTLERLQKAQSKGLYLCHRVYEKAVALPQHLYRRFGDSGKKS